MNRWVVAGLIAMAGWQAYGRYGQHLPFPLTARPEIATAAPADRSSQSMPAAVVPAPPQFACDGRLHCSQMRSYEEAKFFLRHCPGVKMDGDNDGIPCEQQWGHGDWNAAR